MQSNSHPLSPRPSPPSSPLSLSSPLFPSFPPPAPTAASQHASHTSTGTSATSIVRGFSTDKISTSTRSGTQDAPTPTPNSIQKTSPITRSARLPRKKGATFQYGGSSGEDDESSLESRYMSSGRQSFAKSSLADALRSRGSSRKVTSFNEEVATRTIQDRPYESEDVFEDTDEEDEEADRSGSAIEDDDVGEDWEDTDEPSSPLTINEPTFHRVDDTKLNLVSRRSLLTSLMHEKDRAAALQNAASRSSAIRRSRTTSPNGPLGSSPKNQPQPLTQTLAQELAPASRARPHHHNHLQYTSSSTVSSHYT